MPRVVVPTESDERAADISHRRRKVILSILAIVIALASAAFALRAWRARGQRASADTVFVSAPAWPKTEATAAGAETDARGPGLPAPAGRLPQQGGSGRSGDPAERIVLAGERRRAGKRD